MVKQTVAALVAWTQLLAAVLQLPCSCWAAVKREMTWWVCWVGATVYT